MAGEGKKSRKHLRNFRVQGVVPNGGRATTGAHTRYVNGNGPQRHEARVARNKQRIAARNLARKAINAAHLLAVRAARLARNGGGHPCPCWRCKGKAA